MKTKLNEKYLALADGESKQFCGSATLLSLYSLVTALSKEILDYQEAFPDLEKVILRLYDEDSEMFSLLCTKGELSADSWQYLLTSFQDYQELFDDLNNLMSLCEASGKERYLPFLRLNYDFLGNIAKMNLEGFFEREDKPSALDRVMNDVLVAMRRR